MLKESIAVQIMNEAFRNGADFVELFCEDRNELMIEEQGGDIQNVTNGRLYGIGIRVMNGNQSGYTYVNDIKENSLVRAAREAAIGLSCQDTGLQCAPLQLVEYSPINHYNRIPGTVPPDEKAGLLRGMDAYAKSLSPLLKKITLQYFETEQSVTVFNSLGTWSKEKRVYCRIRMILSVSDGNKSISEWHDLIRNNGYDFVDPTVWQEEIATEIQKMTFMLDAESAPSGIMDVVFEKGESSLFHEAVGHPFEGWAVSEGLSVFSGKLGVQVASSKVTWVDNGTVPDTYGALSMDDTGQPTRRNVLIQNGVVTGYMLDRLSARKMGVEPSGNGRRQNYTYAPTDRMTNTYIEPGDDDDDEMIQSLDYGLFVKSIGGGSTNPVTGAFNVEVSEGYLIEHGQITRPVAGMTISGTSDVLMNVDRVGKFSPIPTRKGGFCGGSSGLIPVTCYQPRVRVRGMVVGGKGV